MNLPLGPDWADHAAIFALASTRVAVMLLAAPLWSHTAFPVRARAGLAVLIAAALWPVLPAPVLPGDAGVLEAARAAWSEAWLGFALGFGTRIAFAGFALLGELISVQGGLGAASVLDPASGANSVALASLFQTFGMLVFLAMDGPHLLLRALASSFAAFPVGADLSIEALAGGLVAGAGLLFELAVRIAAPVTVLMWVVNLGIGILGRFVPQLNLMMLQLPANILVTLTLIGFGASRFMEAFADAIGLSLQRVSVLAVGGG